MSRGFHPLVVDSVHPEVRDASTVAFAVPRHLAETFRWRPGQHLSVRVAVKGVDVRRSYSISASPFSGDPLRITVSRVEGGLVSNHVNDHVRPGDVIDVMPPFGSFCLDPGAIQRRTCYFFAAGSGITPVFSMLHSVLLAEPHSVVHLIYGNRSADMVIFKQRLAALGKEHPERLTVDHLLSRPSLWSSLDGSRRGRIDRGAVESAIEQHPPYAQDTQYYLCGPGGMNRAVKAALMDLDVPAGRIHSESFGGVDDVNDSVPGIAATARVRLDGRAHTVPVARGQTVLQAIRAAGIEAPYSCQSGICGACRAQLSSGAVHMRARMGLDDAEIATGAILTCQSVATTEGLSLSFD